MHSLYSVVRPVVMAAAAALAFVASTPTSAGPIDDMRLKWRDTLTGGSLGTANAQIAAAIAAIDGAVSSCNPAPCPAGTGVWDRLDRSSVRTLLWRDIPALSTALIKNEASAEMARNYDRIRAMALAYGTQGSRFHGNAALKADILDALEWMQQNRYKPASRFGNWWHWEIGMPLRLLDILHIMYDDLDAGRRAAYLDTIRYYTPHANSVDGSPATGANRAWKSAVVLHSAILAGSSAGIDKARKAFSDIDGGTGALSVFKYATTGDGFHADGGFIQHENFPYAGGYGTALLRDIANLLYLLQGTQWAVVDPDVANVWRWVGDTYEPAIFRGAFMDMFRGRNISRQVNQDHEVGHSAIAAILRLSQSAPPPYAAAFRRIVKAELLADTYRSFYAGMPPEKIRLTQALMADPAVVPRPPLLKHVQQPTVDRVLHHRGNWAAALSMHSKRIANYESINIENMHGWYTAEGMLYLYNADLAQYSDDFWATVDPYRLPGTTVDLRPRADGSDKSRVSAASWVGGVTGVDSLYGAVGMQLESQSSGLSGRKSWFLFDNEVVALGAGITNATRASSTITVVENRKVAGANAVRVNAASNLRIPAMGDRETASGVHWIHLVGNVTAGQPGGDGDIGYYFPEPATVELARVASPGNWSNINVAGPDASVTRNYVQAVLRHDPPGAPFSSTYAYALLPGMDAAGVADYAARPQFQVLENSSSAQGVKETTLGVTAVNFWAAGSKTVSFVTSNAQSSILVRETDASIEVSVSDPTQENTGSVQVTLALATNSVGRKDSQFTQVKCGPTTSFAVDTAGLKGRSVGIVFNR